MSKRILALILVLCDLAALQNRAAAQARDGWIIDLEPMWMNVKGFDQHNGDVVRSTTVLKPLHCDCPTPEHENPS